MSVTLEALDTVLTLGELSTLVASEPWKEYLQGLARRSDAREEIERLRQAVDRARTRLSPEHGHSELQRLKAEVYGNPTADPVRLRPLLARIAQVRSRLPLREHEVVFGRLETVVGQMFASTNVGTGYSNRARRARDLFTEYAGQTHIEGAETDKHGNASGTGYDLGRDGAFEGHTVHVLHFYTSGFDFSLPHAAFRRKGFAVERKTSPGTPEELHDWLAEARQLWLISDSGAKLKPRHLEVIAEYWRRGGALYVWGDNQPYYADANAVLATLFGQDLHMKGDTPGGKVVKEIDDKQGFYPHLVTTGLAHLFEGITVASLDRAVVERYGFVPLLYGSAGNLITAVRDATPSCGAVMVDTAFTRLYCQWDEAGSARYVCNAACFLAATTVPDEPEVEDEIAPADTLEYDPRGALVGTCDLTGETPHTWLVMSVAEMGDALRNTTDRVLSDPLCGGAWNCIFSDAVYTEMMGRWILNQEEKLDPLSREPVVEVLPLVDLSSERNLQEFTRALCRCLMGGKYLPTPARLLFFAVVDHMLDRETRHPEAWQFLYRQCLQHFRSTPEFTEVGRKVPLLEAMTALFSPATDEMVQVRRSLASVAIIGRTLLREGRATREQVRLIARRSLLSNIVGDALAAEKEAPGSVSAELMGLLYDNFHGLPLLGGGRVLPGRPSFVRDVWPIEQRLESAIGGTPLLTSEEYTAALHALLPYDLRQFTVESAVLRLRADSAAFCSLWAGEGPGDVLGQLNQRFAAYASVPDRADPHYEVPPFATTSGPSVYRCVCGERFGDPAEPLTEATLAALREARTAHFREVYRVGSKGDTWYPAEGTLHYNLHRAVQRVMKEQFPDATSRDEAMIPALAAYLQRDAKGFICDPTLPGALEVALDSYLALRRAGQPHPDGVLTLELKANLEREAHSKDQGYAS
jgi:hypothetical protein